jgi:HTH-type transcriptional regulator/antitoxin HipB
VKHGLSKPIKGGLYVRFFQQEMRKKQKMTQEQLAKKCGTTKTYISRIENDASDIRLSTLMRIIQEGLGGHLRLTVDI